jgi:hypothetical protein
MSGALKKRWFKCSRCNTKLYATVITGHMWKSHRAYMMKNRGGRKAATSTGKPVDLGLHAAREAEQKARTPKSGVAPKKPMPKEYLSDLELALMAGSGKPVVESVLHPRAAYSALPGKSFTLIVHQGKNSLTISNVTLIDVLE